MDRAALGNIGSSHLLSVEGRELEGRSEAVGQALDVGAP